MASTDSSEFYVYVHRRATDGHVFYVGKGKNDRAWNSSNRSKYWKNIASKHGHQVEIVINGMLEEDAFQLERDLIAFYGRKNLANLSDGGDGASGRIVGDNEKRIKSELFKGRPLTQETKDKISKSRQGVVSYYPNDEQKLAISKRTKGRPSPWSSGEKSHMKKPEMRAKFSAMLKGRPAPWIAGDKNPMHKQKNKDAVTARCKGKKRPEIAGGNHKLAKQVVCIENGLVFDSGECAAKWLRTTGFPLARQSNISSACTGFLRSAYGFHWKHK